MAKPKPKPKKPAAEKKPDHMAVLIGLSPKPGAFAPPTAKRRDTPKPPKDGGANWRPI